MSITPPKINTIDEYWFDNNPALTSFMHTLSTLFDKGESYFMHSVTAFIKTHPEFKDQIIKFVREERAHSALHGELNSKFTNKKLLKKLEKRTGKIINLFTRFLNKEQNLAVTAALEHITCSLALQLLKRTDIQDKMISDVKDVWIYHSKEESSESHRSLAYSIYKEVSDNNLQRHSLMILATVVLSIVITIYWIEIMANDSFEGFFSSLNILLNPSSGFITNIIPNYLEWFSSNYTP